MFSNYYIIYTQQKYLVYYYIIKLGWGVGFLIFDFQILKFENGKRFPGKPTPARQFGTKKTRNLLLTTIHIIPRNPKVNSVRQYMSNLIKYFTDTHRFGTHTLTPIFINLKNYIVTTTYHKILIEHEINRIFFCCSCDIIMNTLAQYLRALSFIFKIY